MNGTGHPSTPPVMRFQLRCFAALLWLYPSRFRDACGDEMSEFFAERLSRVRARGAVAVARLWFATLADLVTTAAAEHIHPSVRPTFVPREEPMSSFFYDLRQAARRLRTSPAFTVSAVLLLAVGIGLNAAVFNLADTLLYRPAPFANPGRIVHIYQDSDDGIPSSTAFPAYRDIAEQTAIFAGVAATSPDGAIWETDDGPREVSLTFATASYFPVMGLTPFVGRWFAPEHDQVGSEMAAVVSHRTWVNQFGSDPAVIGQSVRLNNQLVTIIGVGPERFNGEAGALVNDFWLSISSTPVGGPFRVSNLDRREDHWYQVKARLAPGVNVAQARSAMSAAALRMGELYPALDRGRGITVYGWDEVRFHPQEDRALRNVNVGLLVVAGLVLLLACSNLANLLLARGIARSPEIAVREALGAGRMRVARLLLLEALLLASLGGAAGLALGAWAMRLLPSLPIPTPGPLDTGFDGRVLVFGVLLTLATGLIFGLAPALRSARTDLAAALRSESRTGTSGRRTSIVRATLVSVQVAVSIVLVVGAGLLTRSLANAQRVDPGVDADRIAVVGTNLRQGGVTPGEFDAVIAALVERVGALPGVERVALTTRLPVSRAGTTTQEVENYRPAAGTGSVEMPFTYVSRSYFETMGIALMAGRAFTPDDRRDSPRVVVVNEAAAKRYWNGNAVGGRIRGQGGGADSWLRVVGVVEDVKVNSLQEPPTPMIFYSADQAPISVFSVVVRTAGPPAAIIGDLRSALRDVRATLPVTRLLTMETHLGDALKQPRVAAAAMLGGFSLLGLLLASLGVYAVVSFAVGRRTQEMGIRVALGASSTRIMRMVIGESLLSVGVGLAAGLLLAVLSMRALQGMLFGVGSTDAVTFVAASVLLLGAAGVAAYLPARRAARADPLLALRAQ